MLQITNKQKLVEPVLRSNWCARHRFPKPLEKKNAGRMPRCLQRAKTSQVQARRAETLRQGRTLARHYIHVLCHANAYNPSRKQPYSRTINVQTHVWYRC